MPSPANSENDFMGQKSSKLSDDLNRRMSQRRFHLFFVSILGALGVLAVQIELLYNNAFNVSRSPSAPSPISKLAFNSSR